MIFRLCMSTMHARMHADFGHGGRADQPGGVAVVQRRGGGGREAGGGHLVAGILPATLL